MYIQEALLTPRLNAVSRFPSGEVLRQRELPGFTVRQARYRAGVDLPLHYHDHAYITLIMQGEYRESYGGEYLEAPVGSLRYLPAGELHANRFTTDVECLQIQVDPQVLDPLRETSRALDRPGEIHGLAAAWLANRLALEFQGADSASFLALEGMLLEILAEAARSLQARHSGPMPRWMRTAYDYLEANSLEDVRLQDVAQVAGVHPVHLAREFRRHFQCSIGEFIRGRRIAQASKLLARSSTPIAEIAVACGFCDQSHFSSVFKRQMGVTPAKFREAG